ncbi:TetR/AcrR family transcriptional regulator [Mycolicibacter arupensis]|uniref:TetR/AcrR family transcriptional regulator n=1 Tax=Mycolicibacter arupensis TaxID=342002 RepID=UPI003B3A3FC6
MARRRGWGGNPPHTDEEASRRIIDAAVELVAETGSAVSLADVAGSLGVIRQTVYRYFPTADALMRAVAIASVDDFLDRLTEHVRGIHDPADALAEGAVYTLDAVGRSPHLGVMLSTSSTHNREMASEQAQAFGMRMIERFDVDWREYGYDEAALRELVEFALRVMLSFIVAPDDPARSPDELRRYLRRWLGEAVAAQVRHPIG